MEGATTPDTPWSGRPDPACAREVGVKRCDARLRLSSRPKYAIGPELVAPMALRSEWMIIAARAAEAGWSYSTITRRGRRRHGPSPNIDVF